ncbi:hypothetical protein COCMIDRAFT_29776 [Bipolaris oryzae ATCC 44560]|uniref:Uncharacterized protein n=1 Tax=Bipolaris oryzae ATCC 44560 TaxID=930090 RepID=W6ZCI2_COCMI|nr:uncharacterized protein COCMIDRAFT_29776 [Bipolaris oryzae ATCC 44560]EUC41446.1 hypothetical protein COCMIDRAFT_29776 [Bipolaris oryzae ATCC 44560]
MAAYISSDDPQAKAMVDGEVMMNAHLANFRKHGPPPPNYRVERKETNLQSAKAYLIQYQELSSTRTSYDHPLSAKGLEKNPNPIIHNEPELNRPNCPGIVDAPIKYKASAQMKWIHFETWTKALAAALASQKQVSKSNREFYYPPDRGSLIFKNEPSVSIVARAYGASLVVIYPFVSKNKSHFNRIYDIQNRPPIHARWSTGLRATLPPLVLGRLPKQNLTTVGAAKPYDVMCFLIDINMVNRPAWHVGLYHKFNIHELAERMGFPMNDLKPEVFLCNHLEADCESQKIPKPMPFTYDPNKLPEYKAKYPNATMTFERLTQLTLNSHMKANNISIRQYAEAWNEAIGAMICYQLDRTDAKWLEFAAKMEVARKLPF